MEIVIPFIIFAAAVASSVFWVKKKRASKRTEEMKALAAHLQLGFEEADNHGLLTQLAGFQLFKKGFNLFGNGRRVQNVLRETVGDTEFFMFDFAYRVSTGKSSKMVWQTVTFAKNRLWSLPAFHLEPETWWHRLKTALGSRDVNFPDSPDFSEKYWLTGGIEAHIRAEFKPEIRDFLVQRPPGKLEGENYYLIGYKSGKLLSGGEAVAFFQNFKKLAGLVEQGKPLELLKLAELQQQVLLKNEELRN